MSVSEGQMFGKRGATVVTSTPRELLSSPVAHPRSPRDEVLGTPERPAAPADGRATALRDRRRRTTPEEGA